MWWSRRNQSGDIVAMVQPLATSGQCKWTGDILTRYLPDGSFGSAAWTKLGGHNNPEDAMIEADIFLEKINYKLLNQKLAVML